MDCNRREGKVTSSVLPKGLVYIDQKPNIFGNDILPMRFYMVEDAPFDEQFVNLVIEKRHLEMGYDDMIYISHQRGQVSFFLGTSLHLEKEEIITSILSLQDPDLEIICCASVSDSINWKFEQPRTDDGEKDLTSIWIEPFHGVFKIPLQFRFSVINGRVMMEMGLKVAKPNVRNFMFFSECEEYVSGLKERKSRMLFFLIHTVNNTKPNKEFCLCHVIDRHSKAVSYIYAGHREISELYSGRGGCKCMSKCQVCQHKIALKYGRY